MILFGLKNLRKGEVECAKTSVMSLCRIYCLGSLSYFCCKRNSLLSSYHHPEVEYHPRSVRLFLGRADLSPLFTWWNLCSVETHAVLIVKKYTLIFCHVEYLRCIPRPGVSGVCGMTNSTGCFRSLFSTPLFFFFPLHILRSMALGFHVSVYMDEYCTSFQDKLWLPTCLLTIYLRHHLPRYRAELFPFCNCWGVVKGSCLFWVLLPWDIL